MEIIEDFKAGLSAFFSSNKTNGPSKKGNGVPSESWFSEHLGKNWWTYIATGISFVVWFTAWIMIPSNESFNFSSLWLGAGVGYYFFSVRWWKPVRENEIAARIFFGKDAGDVGPGPVYAPLGLIHIRPVNVEVSQKEIPGEPERVYHGDLKDADVDLAGKAVPIRIPFRNSITKQQAKKLFGSNLTVTSHDGEKVTFNVDVPEDGLGQRITAEPAMFVRLKAKNAYQFIRVLGGDNDVAMKQIEDEMVTTFKEFAANMSYAQAVANLRWLNIRLFQTIERRIGSGRYEKHSDGTANEDSWGIDLVEVRVKAINLDHKTNEAIRDAVKAQFNAKDTTLTATAEREAMILRGEGAAQAARELEEQTLVGRAAGQKKIAEELGLSGEQVQAAEIARAIAEGGNTVIIGQEGFGQLAGVVGAMANKKKTSSETQEGTKQE